MCNELKKPHKHAEVIKAWADGAAIEFKPSGCEWRDLLTTTPAWSTDFEYRIKPEPKKDFYRWYPVRVIPDRHCVGGYQVNMGLMCPTGVDKDFSGIKLTIDGETGKLKKVEVI